MCAGSRGTTTRDVWPEFGGAGLRRTYPSGGPGLFAGRSSVPSGGASGAMRLLGSGGASASSAQSNPASSSKRSASFLHRSWNDLGGSLLVGTGVYLLSWAAHAGRHGGRRTRRHSLDPQPAANRLDPDPMLPEPEAEVHVSTTTFDTPWWSTTDQLTATGATYAAVQIRRQSSRIGRPEPSPEACAGGDARMVPLSVWFWTRRSGAPS